MRWWRPTELVPGRQAGNWAARMIRTLLKSKLHRATVTDANLHYEGSLTVDEDLLRAADILEHEQIDVYDISNGARLTTYAINGPAGSGQVCINGAAAHLIKPGDLIIVASYGQYQPAEAAVHRPRIVLVDEQNRALPATAVTATMDR
jgi:aspartate 1-decarboxylase